MQRREFLAALGALALVGCERPGPGGGGTAYVVTLYDLKSGQEIGKKTTEPLPKLSIFRTRPQPAIGFIASTPHGYLIEADSGKVHHFDADGAAVWHRPDACVVFNNQATMLVDLAQSKTVWTNSDYQATGARVVGDDVVLLPHRGGVAALDLNTGKTRWDETKLGTPSFLAIHGGQAIITPYHLNRVEFRDLKTGKPGQAIELPVGAIPSEAILAGDTLVVACPRQGYFAYRGNKLLWQGKLKQEEYYPTFPGADSSLVFLSTDGDEVLALDAATGKQLWKGPVVLGSGCVLAGGVLVDLGRALKGQTEAELSAREAGTGKVMWTKKVNPGQTLCVDDKRVALLNLA